MMQASSLRPLSGMRILVTRPIEQAQVLSEKLRGLGATTIELPTIQIVPAANTAALDAAVENLSEYDWVIFTSVHGVRFFEKRMVELGIPTQILKKVKVASIGPATAEALEHAGKKPEYMPNEYLSRRIVEGLGNVKGKRVLLPRADIASKKLPSLLRERGALVEEVVAYQTIPPTDLTPERVKSILADGVDIVTFTSPSTVRNLAQVLGTQQLNRFLGSVKVACIGPVTVQEAEEFGIDADIVAKSHTVDALVEAIVNETRIV